MMNYNPYQAYPQNYQPQQRTDNLIKVNGIEGAKAYQMMPNSMVALFDANNDLMFVKSTDGAGFPTIDTYRFEKVEEMQQPQIEYVSKEEFEAFKKEVTNGKQSVSRKKSDA